MATFLRRVDRAIAAAFKYAVIVVMAVITVVVFVQVVFRYFLDLPLSWSQELARFGFVWLVFLGAGLLVRTGDHIKVISFIEAVPARGRKIAAVTVEVAVLVCSVMFLIGGYQIAGNEWSQLSPALQLSMGAVYLVIPFSASMMVVWSLVRLGSAIIDLGKGGGE